MQQLIPTLLLLALATSGYAQSIRDNLGPHINTVHDESAPTLTPNGDLLYFWSRGRADNLGFEDIYRSVRDYDGLLDQRYVQTVGDSAQDDSLKRRYQSLLDSAYYWTPAERMDPPLNDPGANLVLTVSPDGNQLLIYNSPRTPGDADLALVQRSMGSFSSLKQLKIEGYTSRNDGSVTAFLCSDNKTLILSQRLNGHDDLYVCERTGPFSFGVPQPLFALNTPGDEITPFLAPDMVTLYFSSSGRSDGKGGLDIYMTRRLDEGWTNWSPPQPLTELNSPQDDYYFKFPLKADYAYFTSTGSDAIGGKDIFIAKLPPAYQPAPVFTVKGKVLNKATNAPMSAEVTYLRLSDGKLAGTATTHPLTGEFHILLPVGERYAILAEGEGFLAMSEQLDGSQARNQSTVNVTLYLAPLQAGQTIQLNNLYFQTGAFNIKPESYPELDRIANMMRGNGNVNIEISGHTDNYGDPKLNQTLSENRAQEVFKYLKAKGVPTARMKPVGYADRKPIAKNDTPEGMQKNRRVDITILNITGEPVNTATE